MTKLGLSLRDVAEASGNMVSHSTVHSILTGRHHGRLQPQTVTALARALRVDEQRLRRAAWKTETNLRGGEPTFRLPKEADRLSSEGRRDLIEFMEMLLRVERRTRGEVDSSTPSGAGSGPL